MSSKKRHSIAEISAKLEEADALIAQGKRQQDVARALEISVMTFHRWRKAQAERSHLPSQTAGQGAVSDNGSQQDRQRRIGELQLENLRLRRLVTDLLLEKIKLEESSSDPKLRGALSRHASH
jgi:putative transposase